MTEGEAARLAKAGEAASDAGAAAWCMARMCMGMKALGGRWAGMSSAGGGGEEARTMATVGFSCGNRPVTATTPTTRP